jgi:hypothetical protein
MEGEGDPGRASRNRCCPCDLQVEPARCVGREGDWERQRVHQALPFLPFPGGGHNSPSTVPLLVLRVSEKRGCSLARCPLSLSPNYPTPTHPSHLWRLSVPNLGRGIPQLRFPPSYLQASGPGPQFLHPHRLSIPASPPPPPRYICILTLPGSGGPGSQDPDPSLATTPQQLGQALTSGAPRPQHKRRRCCSSAPDTAPASSSFSSSFPPPRAALDRTRGAVTGDACAVSRCTGVSPSFLPRPPTPSPVPTRLELPLLPRPPPLASRDGHALSGGCCAGAAGLLKEPTAAIRRAPGLSLAR